MLNRDMKILKSRVLVRKKNGTSTENSAVRGRKIVRFKYGNYYGSSSVFSTVLVRFVERFEYGTVRYSTVQKPLEDRLKNSFTKLMPTLLHI